MLYLIYCSWSTSAEEPSGATWRQPRPNTTFYQCINFTIKTISTRQRGKTRVGLHQSHPSNSSLAAMDEESVLFAVRNLFALGNYQIAINELSTSSRLLQSPAAQTEAKVYLYRSYVGQGKYNLVITDITERDLPEVQSIKLLATYLQAKQKGDAATAEQAISASTALLSDGANNVNHTIQLATATIQVNEGFLEEALRTLHVRGKNLEW